MWILSNKRMKEEEELFRKRIDEMTTDSKITVDMSSQKEYIINKQRYIFELCNTIAQIDIDVRQGIYKKLFVDQDIVELSSLMNKIFNKLYKLECSLYNEYRGLLLSNQWDER